jgi:hypothetical protein
MPTKAEMYENAEKIITGEWMFFRDEWASDIAKLIIDKSLPTLPRPLLALPDSISNNYASRLRSLHKSAVTLLEPSLSYEAS